MKKQLLILLLLLMSFTAQAQNNRQNQPRRQFDPAKFEADMEQFVTTEAGLTQQESAKFLPLYREMRKKQMALFGEGQQAKKTDWNDEKTCEEAIRKHDTNEIKMKEIQQLYHNKFLQVLPATKVMRVIIAEDKFHRQSMRRVADRHQKKN